MRIKKFVVIKMRDNGNVLNEIYVNDEDECDYTWGYQSCLIPRFHRYIDEV